MGFRNDEESRRARVDALLADRGVQEERIESLEERLETLEARIAEQAARLAESDSKNDSKAHSPKKSPPTKSHGGRKESRDDTDTFLRRWRPIFAIGGLALLGLGFGMFMDMRSPESEPPTPINAVCAEAPEPTSAVPTPAYAPTPIDMETLVADAIESAQQDPTTQTPLGSRRSLFTGQVTQSEGAANVEVGATCEVQADAVDSMVYSLPPDGLTILCGDAVLYSVGTRAPCTILGQTEDFGGLFTFTCEDRGIREERPEMELDSAERTLRVWSETHGWEVTIALERAAARVALRRGLERGRGLPLAAPVSLTLRVQGSLGEGGPSNNALLSLEIRSSPRALHNCEFSLRQGRRLIGESVGACILDSQLSLIGIDAGLTDERRLGITMEPGEEFIVIDGAGDERSWHAQTVVDGR